jgi:predicted PurR-regulated permease PerM
VRTRVERVALVVLASVVGIAALRFGRDFFSPLALAIVTALALSPIVRRLSTWVPRWIAAAAVVGSFCGGAAVVGYALSDEVIALVDRLPVAAREVRQAVQAASSTRSGPIARIEAALSELQRASGATSVTPGVTPVQIVDAPGVERRMVDAAGRAGFLAAQVVLVIFLVYFLLASGDMFRRKFVRLSGDSLSRRRLTVELIDDIVVRTSNVLIQLGMVSTLVGVATWLAFSALGVTYAGVWGIAAGLLNVLPYVGPLLVMSGSTVAGLLQFGNVPDALLVGGVSLAITTAEGMILSPLLFGRMSRVNAVAVFLSFLFWNWIWGPVGVLIAVPLLVIVKAIADRVEELQPFGELIGD